MQGQIVLEQRTDMLGTDLGIGLVFLKQEPFLQRLCLCFWKGKVIALHKLKYSHSSPPFLLLGFRPWVQTSFYLFREKKGEPCNSGRIPK